MNLYLIKTKSIRHNYYVVAEHPTQAQEYLKKLLDLAGYDFSANRDAIEITLMAELVTEKDWNGYPDFHEGNNLLIAKEETK